MLTISVRELRNTIPHLRETLAREHELVLVSNGEPVARILPIEKAAKFESMKWFRDQIGIGKIQPDSTATIRAERDLR